ncbi:MAG TPA: transglycosylase SLT domain-containing protein [Lamprocystis sp. (in: g-proteobacteria)]|nr:transglycosylase SLT domain-containing protein [Lamprocystis sp. (in: g-proteobacteria)]
MRTCTSTQRRRWSSRLPALLVALAISTAVCTPAWAKEKIGEQDKDPAFEKALRTKAPAKLLALAARYENGDGVDQNTRKAVQLYCKAAAKGELRAAVQLGQIYAFGRGIYRDQELAAAWFQQAAGKQDLIALNLLKVLKVDRKPKREAECLLEPPLPPVARIASRPHPAKGKVAELVRALAPRYQLDPDLVLALIEAESNFNPRALSPKNAQGLMQLIPATAERFGVQDAWDAEQNLRGGMAYLRWLLTRFKGDVKLALAGYNAGEGAVDRHRGIPPYAETRAYVSRIIERIN